MKDIAVKKESFYACFNSLSRDAGACEVITVRSTDIQVESVYSSQVLHLPSDVIQSCLLFSSPTIVETKSIELSDDGSEYMGSPLKLESCVDYAHVDQQIRESHDKIRVRQKDRKQFAPLPLKIARECLSALNLSGAPLQHPVICLCCPSNSKNQTVAIGSYNHSECTYTFDVSYKELKLDACQTKFEKLRKELQVLTVRASDHVSTHAKAEYQLLSLASNVINQNSTDWGVGAPTSAMSIYVEWSNIDSLLMSPPTECMATLLVQVVSGDKSSLVYTLYEQLEYLKELTRGLSSGKINWPDVVRTTLPLDQVKKLLNSQSFTEEEEETQCNTSLEARRNLDFTDRLWSIVLECQSYSELLEIMKLVMNSVVRKSCNPLMVSASNNNRLAKWIYSQQVGESETLLDLGSLQALVYFIEMGVEKLTKDYIHAYLGNFSGLVTEDKLQRFTRNTVSIQDKLVDLSKLHTVLELSSLLHCTIQLPLATVRAATAAALKHLSVNDELPTDGFELATTVSSISDIIALDSLVLWSWSLCTGNHRTDVRVTKGPTDHSLVLPTDCNEEAFYSTIMRHYQQDPGL
ncbi:protein zwilch homolog isoform X2 [Watersipora subatra]